MTYTVNGLPSWMSFNAGTRVLSGTAKPTGSWAVTVTATDSAGASVSRAFTVTTPNVAPVVANAIGNRSANRNQAWSFQIPANTFSDVNGDALTYSASGLPAGVSFNASTRTLSGTPTIIGTSTITITAADGNGGSRAASFVLSVVNNPPVYTGGLVAKVAQKDVQVSWPLPAGAFTDSNGDALSYTLMVQHPGYEEFYWDDSDAAWALRYVEPVWITVYGAFSINSANGTITGKAPIFYAPVHPVRGGTPQLLESYAVKIIANDGNGGSAEGIFNVSVNLPPVVTGLSNKSVKSSTAFSHPVHGFSDPNGNPMTYSVSGLPAGVSYNSSNGTITGTVAVAGAYTITVTANDGRGGATSGSFVLTILANTAPVAPSIPNQSATVGTAFSYLVPSFSDADNDALTYTASGLPAGMTFNGPSRTLSGTPTKVGSYTVTIVANDGRGGSASKVFTVTVNAAVVPNRAPVIARQAPSPAAHFFSTNRWLVPTDSFSLPADSFVDPDNNPLTYSIIQKPAWLSYSYSGGSGHIFSGVNNDTRPYWTHSITIRATDPSGAYVDMTFTVTSEYDYLDPWNPTVPQRISPPAEQSFVISEVNQESPDSAASVDAGVDLVAASSNASANVQESWYSYNKLNQLVVSGGVLENGQVVAAKNYSSYANVYDAAGNAIAQMQWRPNGTGGWRTTIIQHNFSLRGELLLTFGEVDLDKASTARVIERRSYDDAGRVIEQLRYYSAGTIYRWVDRERTPMTYDVGGMLHSAELTTYDADGRLLSKVLRERSDELVYRAPYGSSHDWSFPRWLEDLDSGDGRDQYSDVSVLAVATSFSYSGGNNGYDAAGRLRAYTYTGSGYTHIYTYAYTGWDSYREQSVTGSSSSTSYRTTTTQITYDNSGRQKELREKTEGVTMDDRVRSFALDGNGQIVSRRDGTVTSANVFQQKNAQGQAATGDVLGQMNQRNVFANGQQVAGLNEAGKIDVLSRLTAFSNTDSGKTQVLVQAGDTLRSIAQRIYGNENLWYIIAEANALSPDGDLVAGTSLTAPEVKTSSNDANTFKPYNPGEITGPTTPSLPYIPPPSGGGCGTLGMVIMVVVAVIVTVYTAGAASGAMTAAAQAGGASTAFASTATVTAAGYTTTTAAVLTTTGSVVAGAAAGAAGAAAGMAVGSAMGVASFNWRGVAAGAFTGAITGGLAGRFGTVADAVGAGSYGDAVALWLANGGANYAGQALAGSGTSFSWRSVATSAVSSLVSAAVTPRIVAGMPIHDEFGSNFASGMTGGMVSAAVRSSFGQTLRREDYMTVVADAFGNALGNAAVRGEAKTRGVQSEPNAAEGDASKEITDRFWAKHDASIAEDLNVKANAALLLAAGASDPTYRDGPTYSEIDGLYGSVGLNRDGFPFDVDVNVSEGGYDLTHAQIDMLTYVGHITNLESGYVYREALGVPHGGMTDAQRSAWRSNYFAVDRVVQELDPHGHSVLHSSIAGSSYEDVPVNAVDAIGWSISKGIDDVVSNVSYATINAGSGWEAGIGATSYAITKVAQPFVHGVGGLFRFFGNDDYRVNAVMGVFDTIENPAGAIRAWNSQDRDDKLGQLGALLVGGAGGVKALSGRLGDVAELPVSQLGRLRFQSPFKGEAIHTLGSNGANAIADLRIPLRVVPELDDLAKSYASSRRSGEVFKWSEFAEAKGLAMRDIGSSMRSKIRARARELNLIDVAPVNSLGVADFTRWTTDIVDRNNVAIGRSVYVGDTLGMNYGSHAAHLDSLYMRPRNYVWDHMSVDGMFQLVRRDVHSVTPHKGYFFWSDKGE